MDQKRLGSFLMLDLSEELHIQRQLIAFWLIDDCGNILESNCVITCSLKWTKSVLAPSETRQKRSNYGILRPCIPKVFANVTQCPQSVLSECRSFKTHKCMVRVFELSNVTLSNFINSIIIKNS